MSTRIDKGDFEMIVRVFTEHIGEVMQYIAEDRVRCCDFYEDLTRQVTKISSWKEEELKDRIWKACDSLEIFIPYINRNDYWKCEEALDMLWADNSESSMLHSFDFRAIISSMTIVMFNINRNKKKIIESFS